VRLRGVLELALGLVVDMAGRFLESSRGMERREAKSVAGAGQKCNP